MGDKDLDALTLGQFIIGRPITSLPTPTDSIRDPNKAMELVTAIKGYFLKNME